MRNALIYAAIFLFCLGLIAFTIWLERHEDD